MKEFKVMASNMYATYRAGAFIASSPSEAIEMAKENYRRSAGYMNDVGAFRFYVVSEWPDNY